MVVDFIETNDNSIRQHPEILAILLLDHTCTTEKTLRHLIWATDFYAGRKPKDEIKFDDVTGENINLVQPRIARSKTEQKSRTRDKAEVFTPRSIVGLMNQSLDWQSGNWPVNTDNWQAYVKELRLEITCGEAPFIVSRYNVVNGKRILKLENRIGFLDRKLQTVSQFCHDPDAWYEWARQAYRASYGYEWQGDNLLLARENLLYTFIDYWCAKFPGQPIDLTKKLTDSHFFMLKEIAEIISWNLFQMDGIKYVVPMSCRKECIGCDKLEPHRHNGKYAKIMDWESGKVRKFVDLLD